MRRYFHSHARGTDQPTGGVPRPMARSPAGYLIYVNEHSEPLLGVVNTIVTLRNYPRVRWRYHGSPKPMQGKSCSLPSRFVREAPTTISGYPARHWRPSGRWLLCIVTGLPAGLLPSIASGLQITEAIAGQLVAVYALGSLLAAIPLTSLTQGLRRRPVLLATIICFVIGNTLTAMAESIGVVLIARFIAGCAAGLAWGILAATHVASYVRQTGLQGGRRGGCALALSRVCPLGRSWEDGGGADRYDLSALDVM